LPTPLLVALNLPVYVLLGKLFFGDLSGFVRSLRFTLTPDILSALRGEYLEDRIESLKLMAWVIICALCVVGEMQLLAPR
jgi:hypothetical protein